MLVTAGNAEKFNMMTASWGGLGFLWNRPVAFVFIRPQRYTFDFVERNEGFTLSFFGEEYRKVLQLCGTKSGREIDKVAETKLTPFATPSGNMAFEEASLVLDCRKCYTDMIEKGNFIDYETVARWYPHEDSTKCMWLKSSVPGDANCTADTFCTGFLQGRKLCGEFCLRKDACRGSGVCQK